MRTTGIARQSSGAPGWRTLTLVLLATIPYVVMAWWPFQWGPPRVVRNRVAAAAAGYHFTPPSVVCRRLTQSWEGAELRLRVVEAVGSSEIGPAGADRAVLLQVVDPLDRAVLELARDPSGWTLRRTGPVGVTDTLRVPSGEASTGEASTGEQVLAIAFPTGRMRLAVEPGTPPAEQQIVAPLPWPDEAHLRLGAAAGGERPWAGEIRSATLHHFATPDRADGMQLDLLAGPALEVPTLLFALPPQLRRSLASGLFPLDSWPDVWLNLFGFVPLGYWLLRIAALRRVTTAIGLAGATSLLMELGQLVFAPRVFSLLDLVANTAGAALGSGCAWWLHRRGSPQSRRSGTPEPVSGVANSDAR